MKKFIYSLSILLSALTFTGCSDFFDPDTDDELNGEDYISSDTEMYTGFIGILTKLQAIGDKELLLTDTRGELLELTGNSTPELVSLYNYDLDLQNNSYANPASYYEVIMACNDYLLKMKEYGKLPGVDPEVWADLVSSTIRVKAWTYKTIAEIYGEAVWFDSAVTEFTELTPANGFELLPIEQVMDRAYSLMVNGWEGVPSNRSIDWIAWLDPGTSEGSSSFRSWNIMVPPYEGVFSELLLWKGAITDAATPDGSASSAYYQQVCDLLLPAISNKVAQYYNSTHQYWMIATDKAGQWSSYFSQTSFSYFELVSVILYDYEHNQNNSINKHFLDTDQNSYLLRPSKFGMGRWTDRSFNPGGQEDGRFAATFKRPTSAQPYIGKYSNVSRTSTSDIHIITYRATMYHFYLMEALNHLHRFIAASAVLNQGVNGVYDPEDPEWDGFTVNWTANTEAGTTKYYSSGLRGCFGSPSREFVTDLAEANVSEAEAVKANDLQILDEGLLEFACEGRTYPFMNRMALRYNDLSIVADRVAPKYAESGKEALIRARILDGANYVHYDLKMGAVQNPSDSSSDNENVEE
ncbi:MAG: hypothetical protein HDS01_00475 [Bacteroides sp.]|nr:hypothetical protein [Bacteroides sp.]